MSKVWTMASQRARLAGRAGGGARPFTGHSVIT